MQTTTAPAAVILATAPVLTEATVIICLYCGNPIDGETDTYPHEDGALHIDCAFQGGFDAETTDDAADVAYDIVKEQWR